ncbi:MAG TPA: hypothetical protein VF670_05115 [Duganella sp.]|jgi:hypothetical protein
MPTIEPLTLTLAELATRWNMTTKQVLAYAPAHSMPMYFYFDGLVFNFGDKWHRANGDASVAQDLDSHQTRAAAIEIDLQRQTLHKRGLLKLTQWEEALTDEELSHQQLESDRLTEEIVRLTTLLKQRGDERQNHVRNGLLRAAPRTLSEIAEHGKTRFPQFAFMPHAPNGTDAAEKVGAGAVIAMEDGFPLKELLTEDDLVISMLDIKIAEEAGFHKQQP